MKQNIKNLSGNLLQVYVSYDIKTVVHINENEHYFKEGFKMFLYKIKRSTITAKLIHFKTCFE